jgi:hypothetical protein
MIKKQVWLLVIDILVIIWLLACLREAASAKAGAWILVIIELPNLTTVLQKIPPSQTIITI